MSSFRTDRSSLENLLVRARERDLSEDERRELKRALETSAALRVAYQVGQDFDRLGTVKAGDDELIARAAARALDERLPRTARGVTGARSAGHPRRLALALGAAAVLVASTTAAWTGIVHPFLRAHSLDLAGAVRPQVEEALPKKERAQHVKGSHVGHLDTPPAAADEIALGDARATGTLAPGDPPATVSSGPATPAPIGAAHPEGHAASATVGATTAVSAAADVFRRANLARHAGDLGRAQSLYGELQTRFPTSDEARLSLVSMGKLLLGAGRAADAERQLSRYLSLGPGELTEEALVARAQCLEQLGRNESERQVWQQLLRQFPASVYGERARERLTDLAAGPP